MIEFGYNKNRLLIKFKGINFFPILNLIKTFPSRQWNAEDKTWSLDLICYSEILNKASKLDDNINIDPKLSMKVAQAQEEVALINVSKNFNDTPIEIQGYNITLLPFQNTGVRYLETVKRGILADSVGIGKTVETLGALLKLKSEGKITHVLIICPKSVIPEWIKMIHAFTDYDVNDISDTREYKPSIFFNIVNYDLLISALARQKIIRKKEIKKHKKALDAYDCIVLDEAHRCGNYRTKRKKVIDKLCTFVPYVFALTATPLQNKLRELYTLISILNKNILGNYTSFSNKYCVHGGWNNMEVVGYKNLNDFNKTVAPYILRRTRSDVAQYLPPKTESRRWIDLSLGQIDMYNKIKAKILEIDSDHTKEKKIKNAEILAQISYIRQVCVSTHLIDPSQIHSSKLELLKEVVEDITCDEDKMIIYCFYKSMCELIEKTFEKYGVVYLNGDNSNKLQELKEEFTNSKKRIFLMTKVGGEGLNLEMANHFIFVNPEFNPKVMEQLYGRIERLTQKKPINIIHLLAKNTYEERIVQILDEKINLSNDTVEQIKYISMKESELIKEYL